METPIRKKQQEIVIAPPGCGKTERLANDIVDALKPGKDGTPAIPPDRILCISFTDQAAGEMRERVQKRVGEGYDLPIITTLHAFCLDRLRKEKDNIVIIDESRFQEFASKKDPKDPKKLTLKEFNHKDWNSEWRDNLPAQEVVKWAFLRNCGKHFPSTDRRDPSKMPGYGKKRIDNLKYYTERYIDFKAELNQKANGRERYMDFNDILFACSKRIADGSWKGLETYDRVFVDEVQDLTKYQLDIIRNLVSPTGIIRYFGDPQQAIYGFMGAKIKTLVDFIKKEKCKLLPPLQTNYRSPGYLIDTFNRYVKDNLHIDPWWEKNKISWEQRSSGWMRRKERPKYGTAIVYSSSFGKEVLKIAELVDSFSGRESNVILARDNDRVRRVIRYLKTLARDDKRPHYIVIDSDGGGHTYFLKLLSAHISVCLNPKDTNAWVRLLPMVMRAERRMSAVHLLVKMKELGFSPLDLMEDKTDLGGEDPSRNPFLSREGVRVIAHKLKNGYRPLYKKTCADIAALRECAAGRLNDTVLERMGAWFASFVYAGFLPPHQKRVWHAAKGMLQKTLKMEFPSEPSEASESALSQPDEVERRLKTIIDTIPTLTADKVIERANIAPKVISVMTIHQAKGRGFDNVFMFEAREEVFKPSYESYLGYDEDLEELRRLFFVGITRAKRRIILTGWDPKVKDSVREVQDDDSVRIQPISTGQKEAPGSIAPVPDTPPSRDYFDNIKQ